MEELCSDILKMEVHYKDIVEKPDYFKDKEDLFSYQLCTKAKAWEHEQEERLVITDPSWMIPHAVPKEFDDKKKCRLQRNKILPTYWRRML